MRQDVVRHKIEDTARGGASTQALTAGGSFDHFRRQGLTAIAP
jgi:hypothetical protein